jgi:hypothetical protein
MPYNHLRQFQKSAVGSAMALVMLCLFAGAGFAQISPGDLSKAHSESDGANHCTDCHKSGVSPPEFNCDTCHLEIKDRTDRGQGYHAKVAGKDPSGRICVTCHFEHNGKDFELVRWELFEREFHHDDAGYRLEGKHAAAACRECHRPENITEESRKAILVRDQKRTYLGLSTDCSRCHRDVHAGQLSTECGQCHTPSGWTGDLRFDHSDARYKLAGKHASVPCEKCHKPLAGNAKAVQYRNISFADCTPCHRNPHGDAFNQKCSSCHRSALDWNAPGGTAAFDHSRTKFPLIGKHATVKCDACHPGGAFAGAQEFSDCRDCHKKDPHRGQFDDRAGGGRCDECHDERGFKPALYGVAEHRNARFPLEDAHAAVPCAKCHASNADGTVYRMKDISCERCHPDPHGAQFAGDRYQNSCRSCHNETAFKPSDFDRDRHSRTRFQLTGGHSDVACKDCHRPEEPFVKYVFEDLSCTQCHNDPHMAQFEDYESTLNADGTAAGCRACHSVSAWKDLKRFDHSRTDFALRGHHTSLECGECHKASSARGEPEFIRYASAPTRCPDCHEDPHMSQFDRWMAEWNSAREPLGCTRCHDEMSWTELPGFDHLVTDFPLEGAHDEVACAKCHPGRTGESGKAEIFYADAPLRCSECHEDIHGGQFLSGTLPIACTECHSTAKWSPSDFDHDTQSDYKLEGGHSGVECGSCHNKSMLVQGKTVTIYRSTPEECSECH